MGANLLSKPNERPRRRATQGRGAAPGRRAAYSGKGTARHPRRASLRLRQLELALARTACNDIRERQERQMSFDQIRLDKQDGIALLPLHRPARMNACTPRMMQTIVPASAACDADDAVRAVIFTGHGGSASCAGADLGGGGATFDYDKRSDKAALLPEGVPASPVAKDGTIDWSHPLIRDSGGRVSMRIFEAKKPVIGAINGAAVGIGATMTLPMDARLASETARYGFVFARRGIVPEAASSWFLPRLVGIANAVDLCCSGRLIDAAEAREKGLVQSVHKPGRSEEHTSELQSLMRTSYAVF